MLPSDLILSHIATENQYFFEKSCKMLLTFLQNPFTIKVAKRNRDATPTGVSAEGRRKTVTTGDLRAALAAMPQNAPVFVFFEGKIAVFDETGDCVTGNPEAYFDINDCKIGKCFYAGSGFCPAVLLIAGEEA